MEIRIRRGRRTDFEALSALGVWPRVDESLRRSIRLFRKTVADLGYDLYVAEDGGETVGMVTVSYVRVPSLGGQRATVEELVVRADRRGSGIGRLLLQFVIGRARRRGVRAFRAVPGDDGAGRFLDRVGLHAAGRIYELELGDDR